MTKTNNSRTCKSQQEAREDRLPILVQYRKDRKTLVQYAKDVGIKYRTAVNDVKELKRRRAVMTEDYVFADRSIQQDEINAKKVELIELRALARSEQLPLKDRLAAALAVIDREIKIMERETELNGWDAPKKTVTAHLTADQSGRFHAVLEAFAGLDEEQFNQQLALARAVPRKALPAPAGPPPLELTEGE